MTKKRDLFDELIEGLTPADYRAGKRTLRHAARLNE